MAYVALCHFNRVGMTVAGDEHIMKEYGISPTMMGWVYTSYLIAYTICMTPGGGFIDRQGPKNALIFMGFGSAFFIIMTGATGLFVSASLMLPALLLVRALLGTVTAPIHPGCSRSVSFWMPYPERSLANGLVVGAATVGTASINPVLGRLIDWFGWPGAFVISGAVVAFVAWVWTLYATDHPRQHPAVNAQEEQLIKEGNLFEQRLDEVIEKPRAADLSEPESGMVAQEEPARSL